MNRILIVVGIIALITILGAGYFFTINQSRNSADSKMAPQPTDAMMETTPMKNDPTGVMEKSSYVPHTKTVLSETKDTKRILFFYANWCPTCRPVDKELSEKAASIPEGVTVIRVNYNDPETDSDEKALAEMYDITYQHTFVLIDENGKALKTRNGGGFDEIIALTN